MGRNPAQDEAISALINQYRSRPLVAIAECERILAKEEPSKFRATVAKIAARAVSHTLFALDAGDDRHVVVGRPRAELETLAKSLAASIEELEGQEFESRYVDNIEAQFEQLAFLPDVDEFIDELMKRLTDSGEKAIAVKAKTDVVAAIEATLALPAPPSDWLGEILAGYTYNATHELVMADGGDEWQTRAEPIIRVFDRFAAKYWMPQFLGELVCGDFARTASKSKSPKFVEIALRNAPVRALVPATAFVLGRLHAELGHKQQMLANLQIAYELGGPSMFTVDDAEFDRYRRDQEFVALLAQFPNYAD